MAIHTLAKTLLAVPLVVVLTGCTEEKAQALLNAVLDFQAKTSLTVDALEEQFLASVKGIEVLSRADLIAGAKAAAQAQRAATGKDVSVDDLVPLLSVERLREKGDTAIREELDTIRAHSERLASALGRLPQARLFVEASTVACVAEVAARLTHDMATYGERLSSTPVSLARPRADLVGQLNAAIRKGHDASQTQILNDLAGVLEEEEKLNDEAIRRALVAAESGASLVEAAAAYNTLTLGDILSLAGEALEVANHANVFDTVRIGTRLAEIRTDLSTDEVWGPILDKPVGAKGTPCNPVETEA